MLRQEFEKLTGFFPSGEMYAVIEQYYYDFDGDKAVFCDAYKNNQNGLAEKIKYETDKVRRCNSQAAAKREEEFSEEIQQLKRQIEELKQQLENEEEWQPYCERDNFPQDAYLHLQESCKKSSQSQGFALMSIYDWKRYLSDRFGFQEERVKIIETVPRYEINRHHVLRQAGEYERKPLWVATDWNYCRFNCGCMEYEFCNGRLCLFCD